MKAVILVGGFGTRLRPFTFTLPKPLIPFVNMAIMEHQIAALVKAGVTDVILAVGHLPHRLLEMQTYLEETYKIKIHFSVEDIPLGTAGPLSLCRDILLQDDEPFFMLNSDVGSTFPFESMLEFHRSHGKEGTIFVTPVEDPSKYGLVVSEKETSRILEFLEKPENPSNTYPSNTINAGMYLLNKSVLSRLPVFDANTPARSISIERQIFPAMVKEETLYSMLLPGYWMDIGQPKDFLIGTRLHLQSLGQKHVIHPTAKVSDSAIIGNDVVIGPGCVIGDYASIKNSTIMENTVVEAAAFIADSIIGWDSKIRSHAKVEKSFLGADVEVGAGTFLLDTVICPHKGQKTHNFSGIIM